MENLKKSNQESEGEKKKRTRTVRDYPVQLFEESFKFSEAIYQFGVGQKVRKLKLFDHLGKSPEGGTSRALIINSNKYGLINGSINSEFLELTPKALQSFKEEVSAKLKIKNKIELCISSIPPFNTLYEKLKGNKLPNREILKDILKDSGTVLESDLNQIVDLFIGNIEYLGLLKEVAGSERIISVEHLLEEVKDTHPTKLSTSVSKEQDTTEIINHIESNSKDENNICFYISPIGEENSDFRRHADLFLEHIVEPAISSLGLKVLRADKIESPGIITKQIIELIFKSKLVIADLSFNNPNVFYELALRHMSRLPTVQIIKKGDKIPFDVSSSRTVIIDDSSIYTLIPKLEIYRAEISNQARQALQDENSVDNPITQVFPNLKVKT